MAKKGELSKTARASMANREDANFITDRTCEKCGERIMLKELQPVKIVGQGMVFFHKNHFTVS
jgi:DNA-directed RNA polymerase subunit RPC12/RpoP